MAVAPLQALLQHDSNSQKCLGSRGNELPEGMMCRMTQWAAISYAFALELGCFIPCYVVSVCYQSYTVAISLVPDPCLVCFLHLTCSSVLLLVWFHPFLLHTTCGSWESLIASKDSWLETVLPCWLWALILCHVPLGSFLGRNLLSWSLLHRAEFTYAFRCFVGPSIPVTGCPLGTTSAWLLWYILEGSFLYFYHCIASIM